MHVINKILFFFLSMLVSQCDCSASLLGTGAGGGGFVKGSSFSFDTQDKRMTRVHGTGIKLELDLIETKVAGGILKYTPSHFEFVSVCT